MQILLINDVAGYSKVATAAMLPVLSYMGHITYNLPTALVSNNLDYGLFNILDTTEYIRGVFPVWKKLGFKFDAISTGFIASEKQAQLISSWCKEQARQGTPIFVDPIMADSGRLYNGVTPSTIQSMREMVSVADLIFPNYTEACYLTDTPYSTEGLSMEEARRLVDKLRKIGTKSVVITSATVNGEHCVTGYNVSTKSYFTLPYEEIPIQFPGTGDIFSAVLIGNFLKGLPLPDSTRIAMDVVYELIDLNKDADDIKRGIPLELYLSILDKKR